MSHKVGIRPRWRLLRRRRTPGAGRTGRWRSLARLKGSRGVRISCCAGIRPTCRGWGTR